VPLVEPCCPAQCIICIVVVVCLNLSKLNLIWFDCNVVTNSHYCALCSAVRQSSPVLRGNPPCVDVDILAESAVNVKDLVQRVREQRPGMVQTEAQYKFLYDVIRHIVEAQKTVPPTLSLCITLWHCQSMEQSCYNLQLICQVGGVKTGCCTILLLS